MIVDVVATCLWRISSAYTVIKNDMMLATDVMTPIKNLALDVFARLSRGSSAPLKGTSRKNQITLDTDIYLRPN